MTTTDYGYHRKVIPKRPYGTLGKIEEELEELRDAEEQGNKILVLCELADLVGAIEGYLETSVPGLTLQDLITMSDATKRAFKSGHRVSTDD